MRAVHELALAFAALAIVVSAPPLVGLGIAVAAAFAWCAQLEHDQPR